MPSLNREPLTVAVTHRLPVITSGVLLTLGSNADFRVSRSPVDGPVDVLITDYEQALALASGGNEGTRRQVLIITDAARETEIRAAFRAGIAGYVLYDCSDEELAKAVTTLGRGDRHFCARVVDRMADSLTHDALTLRELQVLSLMTRGFNNKLIARELQISIGTVKTHANAIYAKLNTGSRLEAVAIAVRRGIGPAGDLARQQSNDLPSRQARGQ